MHAICSAQGARAFPSPDGVPGPSFQSKSLAGLSVGAPVIEYLTGSAARAQMQPFGQWACKRLRGAYQRIAHQQRRPPVPGALLMTTRIISRPLGAGGK